MPKSTNEISWEDFDEIVYGSRYKTVQEEKIIDKHRWTSLVEQVMFDKQEYKYFRLRWEVGNTEMQEVETLPTMVEVIPDRISTVVYKEMK